MKLHWIFSVAVVALVAAPVAAAPYGSPSVLPIPRSGPQLDGYASANRSTSIYSRYDDGAHEAAPEAPAEMDHAAMGEMGGCGSAFEDACNSCGDSGWYARVGGLFLSRDQANHLCLSYDSPNPEIQVLGNRDVDLGWEGGWEATIGKRLSCDCAWEATYWGTGEFTGSASVNAAQVGVLDSSLDFGGLFFGATPVADWYTTTDGAHRLERSSEFHNIEFNFLCDGCDTCRYRVSWLAGLRYMWINDVSVYGTTDDDESFDFFGDEAYYDIDVENNLIGAQIGGRIDYYFCNRAFDLWAATKVGLYANHMNHRSQLYSGDRSAYAFDIPSSKDDIAMVAQIDLGADWQITSNLKLFGGYRVVAMTGVALSDHQVPYFIADRDGIASIDSNGQILLHGAFFGGELTW